MKWLIFATIFVPLSGCSTLDAVSGEADAAWNRAGATGRVDPGPENERNYHVVITLFEFPF